MRSDLVLIMITLSFSTFAGCTSDRGATTPREFVEKYSKAWQQEDVATILSMQQKEESILSDSSAALKKLQEGASSAEETAEVEQSISRRDFAYIAWTHTVYAGDRVHDDHIHVDVMVDDARSEVVLVREGEFLKLPKHPERYH